MGQQSMVQNSSKIKLPSINKRDTNVNSESPENQQKSSAKDSEIQS